MKIVIQRVNSAGISIDQNPKKHIGAGLVVFIGIGLEDETADIEWGAEKVLNMRVFPNAEGKFDRSVSDIKGEILAVSQFTLFGDCAKGRRPDFTKAARPEKAVPLYDRFVELLKRSGLRVETGQFGAHMLVDIVNDGPVTIILDSKD